MTNNGHVPAENLKYWYAVDNLWKLATFWVLTFLYAITIALFSLGHTRRTSAAVMLFVCWFFLLHQHREASTREALSGPLFGLSILTLIIAEAAVFGRF
jgi:hypothetical protein